MRIDQATDELMWLIAEQGEPGAVEALVKRRPELHAEMLKRLELVRGLKGLKRTTAAAQPIPVFAKRTPRELGAPRWAMATLATVALLGIGSASFFVAKGVLNKPEEQAHVSQPTGEAKLSENRTSGDPTTMASVARPTAEASLGPNEVKPIAAAPTETAYSKLVTLEHKKIGLYAALNSLARQSGINIQIGPGLENVEIVCSYAGQPAIKVLNDLAATLGFTVFEQGNDSVLIIPETDPNKMSGSSGESKTLEPAPGNEPTGTEQGLQRDSQPGG